MDFYDLFEQLLKERDLKPADVAKGTGITTGAISHWKLRKYVPKADKRQKLADFFGVPVDYFDGKVDLVASIPEPNVVKIKILGTVPAGMPIEAVEDIIGEETISMKDAQTGKFFGLRIKGDSMDPDFRSGDIVVVRQQEDIESGQIAIVIINGDEATCKKVEKYDNGIMLVPLNKKYEEKFYSNEDIEKLPVRIIGRVVQSRRNY